MAQKSPYVTIIAESFIPAGASGRHGKVHMRPAPNQVFGQNLSIECSKTLTSAHPVGTRFRMRVKLQFHPDIGLPRHVTLHHKAAETFAADLSFSRTSVEDLHAAIARHLEPDMFVEQRQKSAVIRIATGPLSVVAGCADQIDEVRAGLICAQRLAAFFGSHPEVLSAVPHR